MAIVRKHSLDKLSGWTAIGVILVSLAISKYLATNSFIDSDLSTDLASLSTLLNSSMSDSTALEHKIFNKINEYRIAQHLPPLALDPRISEQARKHSQDMANSHVPFSSAGFDLRSDAINQQIPYQAIAENVAYSQGHIDPIRTVVNKWLTSIDSSLTTIEGDYELTGIGVARNINGEYYFTQIFVRRCLDSTANSNSELVYFRN